MNTLLTLSLVLTSASCTWGFCCVPDQFEGKRLFLDKTFEPMTKGFGHSVSEHSYDYVNKRESKHEKYVKDGVKFHFHTIKDYGAEVGENGVMWVINHKDNSCEMEELTTPMQRICVNDKAKFLGAHAVGDLNGTNIQVGRYEIVDADITVMMEMEHKAIASEHCMPVSRLQFGKHGLGEYMVSEYFYDNTEGIKHASVFDVPKFCLTNGNKSKSLKVNSEKNPRWAKARRNFN